MICVCVRVHGFHVYQDVWRPVIEELRCQREEHNPSCCGNKTTCWYCRACLLLSVSTLFCIYKMKWCSVQYCVVTGTCNTPYKLAVKTFMIHQKSAKPQKFSLV